ncbi:MAG: HAMP domain-containing histidine kinase [Chromatiaceae bacterium]|nr:HAMP domain-containing histidine kinase [Chromatiaceae bacterium]
MLYLLIAGGGLAVVYWAYSFFFDAQEKTKLRHDLASFLETYNAKGKEGIEALLDARESTANTDRDRFLIYVDEFGKRVAGDLKEWPAGARADNQVENIQFDFDILPYVLEDHDGDWLSIGTTFVDGSQLVMVQRVQSAEDRQEIFFDIFLASIAGLMLMLGWRAIHRTKMNRLLRTSAIRLSLRYTLFYILIAGGGLAVLYWTTSRYVDVQIRAGLQQHLTALQKKYDADGAAGIKKTLDVSDSDAAADNHRFTLYIDSSGNRIAGDLKGWPANAQTDGQVTNIWVEDDFIPNAPEDHDGYWPSVATIFDDGSRLLIVQSVKSAEELQDFIVGILISTLTTIIALTLLLGWRLGRQLLARVDQVNVTAGRILDGCLDKRIPITGAGDEFDELANKLNAMLDHINRLIHGMRQVTDNVAHDLRRPLTRIRSRLDFVLREPRDSMAYRESLEQTQKDIEDVLKTFNALLEIAQAEAGHFRGELGPLDISALATELGEMYADFLAEHGQALSLAIDAGLCVYGNRQLLAQVISNLIENAHKHAGAGARVELRVWRDGNEIALAVSDNGPGIPEDKRQYVLQRYTRLDAARSTTGNGLGLSLVNAVARLHAAGLSLEGSAPGLTVSLRFPSRKCPSR